MPCTWQIGIAYGNTHTAVKSLRKTNFVTTIRKLQNVICYCQMMAKTEGNVLIIEGWEPKPRFCTNLHVLQRHFPFSNSAPHLCQLSVICRLQSVGWDCRVWSVDYRNRSSVKNLSTVSGRLISIQCYGGECSIEQAPLQSIVVKIAVRSCDVQSCGGHLCCSSSFLLQASSYSRLRVPQGLRRIRFKQSSKKGGHTLHRISLSW